MLNKMLLIFAIFGIAIASAKSYRVTLTEPYAIGSRTLKPGDYHLSVNGTTAVLTDSHNKVKISGTTQNENEKFAETAILSDHEAGASQLKSVQLGGTHLQVDFNR